MYMDVLVPYAATCRRKDHGTIIDYLPIPSSEKKIWRGLEDGKSRSKDSGAGYVPNKCIELFAT